MTADSLLIWMSARGQGSWHQYASAVEELHLPEEGEEAQPEQPEEGLGGRLSLQNLLRLNLQRLGHAEFRAGARPHEWRIAPPVLALTETPEGAKGVLAGARSKRLMERLHDAASRVATTITPQQSGPDAVVVEGDVHALAEAATSAGLTVQRDAARQLLMALPIIDDRRLWRRCEAPVGADWRIERFSALDLCWKASTRAEFDACSLGLFRYTLSYRRHMLLRARGGVFEVSGQVGKYLVLRRQRRRTVAYQAALKLFRVPAICRPPFLVERALISCSGLLPSHQAEGAGGGTLHYHGVSEEVASLASAVLRQELR